MTQLRPDGGGTGAAPAAGPAAPDPADDDAAFEAAVAEHERRRVERRTVPALPADGTSRALGWLLLIAGALGALAAAVLTVEKFKLLTDPGYVPSCSLNAVISCGSVMQTTQAQVFGFPNPLMGIAGFAMVAASGAAVLAGARLAGWYWAGLQVGVLFGIGFVHWLMFQSLYRIGALCPYCMVVWAVTIPLFVSVTRRNVRAVMGGRQRPVVATLVRGHGVVLATWYLVVVLLVGVQFWSYWRTLL